MSEAVMAHGAMRVAAMGLQIARQGADNDPNAGAHLPAS